jgi:methylated-DNA-[protein]-cysteine S-methyltransferase
MSGKDQFVTTMDSPHGELTLLATDDGLRLVKWLRDGSGKHEVNGKRVKASDHPVLASTARQLEEYFAGGRREFDVPFDLVGTDFQLQAWMALAEIPFGTTSTYSGQAIRLGRPAAVRAVGAANGRNPVSIILPCHRVVGKDGSLTGYAGGLNVKAALLEHEMRVTARPR